MQGSARDFLKPKLVDSVELSKNEYRVVLEPFERGFGHTLGNSIRRTLLSSMVGSAITEVAIDGVMHEFSTIENVQEDVLDILLNLKEASIGLNSAETASVIIEKEGPCQLTVADIEAKNKIQNKNIWFLDPVALNMRFLANNPLPDTDERWNLPETELLKMKSMNTIRRLQMNETSGEGAGEVEFNQETLSARDTLMGYVTPGASKR